MIRKTLLFVKRPRIIIIIIVLVLIALFISWLFGGSKKTIYSFVPVERGQVVQEVSITGQVKPVENVELAFEKLGKVAKVFAGVGDHVGEGAVIVALENSDLMAQLRQAQASYEAANATYLQYQKGTRPEEIKAAETAVTNAQESLSNAQENLIAAQNKAESDLRDKYDSALTAAQKSVSVAKTTILTITDIQYSHFNNTEQNSINIKNAKADAVFFLLGAQDAGSWLSEFISPLSGGAFGRVQTAMGNPTYGNIDQAVSDTAVALQYVRIVLDIIPVNDNLTSTEKTNLSTEKTNINAEIINIDSKKQAIASQKTTNASNISSSQTSLTTARNTLALAEDDLILKKAGYTSEQITAQRAQMNSARANVDNLQAQLDKTIIKAPFAGIVTKQEAKVGEIVSAQTPVVSLISEAEFEVEANIQEVDIAKIKLGDAAKVTLDAYGEELIFQAEVFKIDPAETIIEGVPTYKVKLRFSANDERIKSGMTANTDILTAKKENVLVVPYRAVSQRDGGRYVQVKVGNVVVEKKVEVGLRGSDGNIEIISGLEEGEEVVNFVL